MPNKLSVIIPSLGGDLIAVLDALNSGSLVPNEIIICLPNASHYVIHLDEYKNTQVIYSDKYSQVYQRICGFKAANNDFILQLDDDIVLEHDCIEVMLGAMKESKKEVAISPYWLNIEDNKPFCPGKKNGFIMTLYYWLLNGAKGFVPGGISLAGTEFCINLNDINASEKIINVEWQSGGCVLHKKENLILDNYYQFTGKAYSEDLFHSYFLKEKGVTLIAVLDAVAYVNINPGISIAKELWASFKVRLNFVRMANLSVLRMMIYFSVYISKTAIKSILGFINKR